MVDFRCRRHFLCPKVYADTPSGKKMTYALKDAILSYYPRITSPYIPHLLFVGRLGVVRKAGAGKGSASPTELQLLFGSEAL